MSDASSGPRSEAPLLLTNDDGIDSFFLRALAEALSQRWPVCVVAPAREQSWSGRSVSRQGQLEVRAVEGWPGPAWSVDGTPTDCANLGLYSLLKEKPRAVISGMNFGFNVSLPLILSSGTVAGAIEGALAGLPAVAFSLALAQEDFLTVKRDAGRRGPEGDRKTRAAAARAAAEVALILEGEERPGCVHNLNLPDGVDLGTKKRETRPAQMSIGGLFQLRDGVAEFRFPAHTLATPPAGSDLECVLAGEVSHSLLNLSAL